MINYFFVHSSGRQKFEELKIAADKDNSRYYVGTNFSRSYEGEPSPHCEYDSLIFLSGDDAQIITHGTKIPLSAITPSGDSATLRFETAEDSYNLVDPGITDALEVGAKIIVHTNYEDLSQPTTFATPWNDNNKVVFFPDDHTPDYLFDAGVEVNSLALISNFGYTMMYIGDVDGTDVWMVLNASGTEPNGLQLLQPQYLTDNQKIAVYRYMASVNATGERIANSLGIDYCLYEEQTDNDVKLFRIVVKYVGANIKCDYYEGKTADGSTFITNSCTDIDPHDLIPIIAEFDTIKLLCKDMQEDIKNLQDAVEPIEELSESIETLQSDVEGNAERINKQSGFFSALWDGNNTISVYGIDDALCQRLIDVSEVETEVSAAEESTIIEQPNPNKRYLPLLLPVQINSASALAALDSIYLYTRDYDEENTSAPVNSYSLRVVDANGTTVTASSNITPSSLGYSAIMYLAKGSGSSRICYLKLFAEIKVNPAIQDTNTFLFGGQVFSPAELPSSHRLYFANKMLKVEYDRVKDVSGGIPEEAGGEFWEVHGSQATGLWLCLDIYPMSYFYKMLKLKIDKSCMGYIFNGNIEIFLLPADYATHFPSQTDDAPKQTDDAANQWIRDNKIELELVDENTEFFDDNETVKRFSKTYKLYDDSPSADYVVAINYKEDSTYPSIVTYNNRINASYMLIPYVIIDGKKCYYHDERYLYDNNVGIEFSFMMPYSDITSLPVYFDLPNGKAWLGNSNDKYVLANDGKGNYPKAVEDNSELYNISYEWQPVTPDSGTATSSEGQLATQMYVLDYTNTANGVVNLEVNELLSNININGGVSVVLTPSGNKIIIDENTLGVKITDANNSMSPSGANIYCQIYDNTGKLFKGVISKTVCCTWLGQAIYLPFAANENLALLTADSDFESNYAVSEGGKYIMIDNSNSDAYIDVDSNETEVSVVFDGVNHNETVIYFDGGTTISFVIGDSTYNIVGEVPNFETGTKYVMAIKDNYVVFGTVAADEEEE